MCNQESDPDQHEPSPTIVDNSEATRQEQCGERCEFECKQSIVPPANPAAEPGLSGHDPNAGVTADESRFEVSRASSMLEKTTLGSAKGSNIDGLPANDNY